MVVDNRISMTFVAAAFCLMIITGIARIHHAKPIANPDRAQAQMFPPQMLQPTQIVNSAPAYIQGSACVRARDIPLEAA